MTENPPLYIDSRTDLSVEQRQMRLDDTKAAVHIALSHPCVQFNGTKNLLNILEHSTVLPDDEFESEVQWRSEQQIYSFPLRRRQTKHIYCVLMPGVTDRSTKARVIYRESAFYSETHTERNQPVDWAELTLRQLGNATKFSIHEKLSTIPDNSMLVYPYDSADDILKIARRKHASLTKQDVNILTHGFSSVFQYNVHDNQHFIVPKPDQLKYAKAGSAIALALFQIFGYVQFTQAGDVYGGIGEYFKGRANLVEQQRDATRLQAVLQLLDRYINQDDPRYSLKDRCGDLLSQLFTSNLDEFRQFLVGINPALFVDFVNAADQIN